MIATVSDQVELHSAEEKAAIDKRILRKLDVVLIPWLCLLYLLAFLDRSNIGNAKIDGLEKSLHLTNAKYNASLSIFFISYSVFEPLTNVILKWLRPSIFIPIIMITWGLCMTLMGLVDNWAGLMTSRWFLGLAEAGLFPGVSYYLSCWYRRSELGIRSAIFFSAAAVSGSFGGLLAAAIGKMDGIGKRPGWAWIFILEGILTILIGVASFWKVEDFPDNASFLTPTEREHVIRRLRDDRQSAAEHEDFRINYLWMALKDYKTWLAMAIFAGIDMPLYALSMFIPSIISELGYSSTTAQLLSVPPYVVATMLTVYVGWIGDRTSQRGLCNIYISLIGILGFTMLLVFRSAHVRYAGTFLATLGVFPCVSNSISWFSNNIEGSYKRGIVLGLVIGFGNINGVVSSNIYFKPPNYIAGHATVIAYMSVFLLGGSIIMRILLKRENRLKRSGKRDHRVLGLENKAIKELGDAQPDFIYTL